MSGFQSIEELMKKNTSQDPAGIPQSSSLSANVSPSTDVEEKFQKKMYEVALKEKEVETERYASEIGVPHINLKKFPISQVALRQLTEARARETATVCFFASQDEVRVGAIDPTAEESKAILSEIQEKNGGAHGEMYTISEQSFNHVMDLYKTLPIVEAVTKDVMVKQEDLEQVQADVTNFESFQSLLDKKSTTDLVTFVMGAGLKLKASDIHIEAEEHKIAVRFRMDGMLNDAATLPREAYKKLVSRIKLLSSLKINISDKPQDGRFTVKLPDGDVDVRVSTIPTVYGESIVMRLLVQHQKTLTLDSLGLRGRAYDMLMREIQRPNGMIITTGPTGSGKTTTLYAIMHLLNKEDVKIITLEDPVEYKMEGINQSQIDKSHDYTFAKGLRSMMRQDPDIAMVGEIRDLETAEIAVQAALTGHLMLSTIHTNDAFGAIPRFLSIGVQAFLLAPALNCVIGQRLVRKLCDNCKQPAIFDPSVQVRIDESLQTLPQEEQQQVQEKGIQFFSAVGCDACHGIGYTGRLGIYEIFVIDKNIEEAILAGNVAEYEIRKIATEHGTVTMVQDGLLKALDGLTSVEEVFRVTE